jgi:hypothetical protein
MPKQKPAPSYSEGLNIVGLANGQAIEYGGVRFETPPSSGENPNSISSGNGSISFRAGGISASLKGGVLTVEGDLYGQVNRGDLVKLSEDGTVSVNGQVRKKLTEQTSTISGVRFVHFGNLWNDFHYSSDDGSLVIGGESYGTVKKGDEVRRQLDGMILVNGEVRSPQ